MWSDQQQDQDQHPHEDIPLDLMSRGTHACIPSMVTGTSRESQPTTSKGGYSKEDGTEDNGVSSTTDTLRPTGICTACQPMEYML